MVQQSWVIELPAIEVDEAELQIAVRFGVFAVSVQELLVTAKWYFVVPDYDAIEMLLAIHGGLLKRFSPLYLMETVKTVSSEATRGKHVSSRRWA